MQSSRYLFHRPIVLGSAILCVTLLHQRSYALAGVQEKKVIVAERDGSHDFDFLFGTWRVHNRKLMKAADGTETWAEFDSTADERPFWDGRANVEEWRGELPTGHLDGTATRIYNPNTHEWSIYWATQAAGGTNLIPMVGHFANGRGEFFDQEENGGKQVFVRFTWTSLSADECRWEQAISTDGARTWKTNWTMVFMRQK